MRVAIHQSQYLPWSPYFWKIANADLFVVMDNVQYQRNGVQNRNKLRGKQGEFYLTVPLKAGSLSDTILDKQISDSRWARKHWQSIRTSYGRAPNWPALHPGLEQLYGDAPSGLYDINARLLEWMLASASIDTRVAKLSDLNVQGSKSELVLNICRELGATEYLSGSGARDYLDVEAFKAAGIDVLFRSSQPATYSQFHGEPFSPALSFLDMLFNATGTEIQGYLQSELGED